MSTIQERQKKRAANHEARAADSKKSLGQKVGNFFTRRKNASAPANKRMTTYKVFKGYTPKNKRSLPWLGNNRNIVWDLAVNEPNDGVVNKAKARYLKLLADLKKGTLKDNTELYTLYQLLKDKKKFGNIKEGPTGGIEHNYSYEIKANAPTPAAAPAASSAPAAAATVGSTPAFPRRPPGLDPKPARAAAAAAAKAASAAAASSAPAAAPASAPANAAANAAASAPANAAKPSSAAAPAPSAAPAAAPSPSAAPANAAAAPANAANSGNPTHPASGATSINSNAGDPESIEGTIKKMKCTVCKSQEIISEALGTPARSCNKCNTVAAPAPNVNLSNLREAMNTSDPKRKVYIDKRGEKAYIVKNGKQIAGKLVGPDNEGDYYIDMPGDKKPVWLSENNIKLPNNNLPPGWTKKQNATNIWYVHSDGRSTWTKPSRIIGRPSRRNTAARAADAAYLAADAAYPSAAASSAAPAITSEPSTYNKDLNDYVQAIGRNNQTAANAVLGRNSVTNEMVPKFMKIARNGLEAKPINTSSTSGGRRSRRRHRKTSLRTKNKRSTRRR